MNYIIFHPKNGELNLYCSKTIEFEQVAIIKATSLQSAFKRSQNDFNKKYSALNIRSTSVGDIISKENGIKYMVMGSGFKQLEEKDNFLYWK